MTAFLKKFRKPKRDRPKISATISKEAFEVLDSAKSYYGSRSDVVDVALLWLGKTIKSGKIPRRGVDLEG